MKKVRDIWDAVTLFICFAVCVSVGIFTLMLPKSNFSEEENRALAGKPDLSVNSLVNGRYFQGISELFSDHIVLRTAFVRGRSVAELCFGRQESGEVLFYSDGALAQRSLNASQKLLLQNLEAIADVEGDLSCVIVPRAIDVLGFPHGAGESEAALGISRLAYSHYSLGGELLEKLRDARSRGRVYYATDHHLTTYGSYVSYDFLAKVLDYEPIEEQNFFRQTVTSDFLGTSYSAAGLVCPSPDVIELWRYEGDERLRVLSDDGDCQALPLYDASFLDAKDKYRIFLGGNHAILHVCGESKREKLLLIKDSYANALIPFLAMHFDLTVIDPRYTSISVRELIGSGEYDKILIFCGVDTLATGNDLARSLR